MKNRNWIYSLLVLEALVFFGTGCSPDNPEPKTPTLTTSIITDITQTTAISGGNITSDGGAPITIRGICWSTVMSPTVSDNMTTHVVGKDNFTGNIVALTANTTYHVRAYATNSKGTGYGNDISFTTQPGEIATLTTSSISGIGQSLATGGGNIITDGGSTVTRGVCWATVATPTINDSKTTDGTGTGNFSSSITGLTTNTTYFVRAYATNSTGTSYGSEVSFTTQQGETVTDIDGNVYNQLTIGTQVWMVENLRVTKYNDGTVIPLVTDNTAWSTLTTGGYCWAYNDEATFKITYGGLYNWFAINTGKVCPADWHVPTDVEWTTLTTYLGSESVAGGKLKEAGTTHWIIDVEATNESGFTGLPGGYRYYNDPSPGVFGGYGEFGYWWSSSEQNTDEAWMRDLSYGNGSVDRDHFLKGDGLSVRCIKD